jgi:hypothetical protein
VETDGVSGDVADGGWGAGVAVELVYETHSITTDNEAGIATPGSIPATEQRLLDRL